MDGLFICTIIHVCVYIYELEFIIEKKSEECTLHNFSVCSLSCSACKFWLCGECSIVS